ncbi:Uncharacterized protein FKW44_003655, partial [Caligus rogercresseyi]
ITTGSLPTFIDASSNFGSFEIDEDNFIHQLMRNNKSTVFAGDDTWLTLYPNGFKRSYPYPSFNIRDLDTVDRGVEKASIRASKRGLDVFIGHFLGVDHAGHSYGPNHKEMSRKIQEMSDIVGYVADRMSNDTVLFVLGDHGMTNTGDHGGDSRDEISSTFLVYNKKYKFRSTDSRMVNPSQIDFLPTASLWMASLSPSPTLEPTCPSFRTNGTITTLSSPTWTRSCPTFQGYFTSSSRQEFSKTKVRHLEDLFREFKAQLKGVMSRTDFRSSEKLGFEILDHAKRMCQSVWAQFNLTPMGAGLSLILVHTSALLPLLLINDSDFLKVLNKDFLPLLVISGLVGAGGLPVFASLVNPDLAFNPLLILSSGASLSVIVFG